MSIIIIIINSNDDDGDVYGDNIKDENEICIIMFFLLFSSIISN